MTFLINALAVAGPALCLAAYGALIGFGLQAALASQVRFAVGLGVVCGVGLGLTAVAMCLAYVLFGNATLPLIPLAVLALLAIVVRTVAAGRDSKQRLGQAFTDTLRTITPLDMVAAAAATLMMVPVLGYGLAYWTTGTHDFPSYAASIQVWSSPAAFAEAHPDAFGQMQLHRASFEKPMVTALLVAMSSLSGVSSFQLLAPAMLLFLYVFLASALTLCSRLFRLGPFTTAIAVLPAGLSIVPMSRLYDAQPGQVAAVAFIACLLAVLSTTPVPKTAKSAFALAVVAALIWAAAVGSNFTLVIGSGLALAALLVWTMSQERDHFVGRMRVVGLSAGILAILSLPMLGMYVTSFSGQTTGEAGFDIPLVTPLAVIGQQASLSGAATTSQALLSWGVVLLGLVATIWLRAGHDRRAAIFDFALLAAVVANVLVIGLKFGWVNYAVHKWIAVAVAIVVPLVLSYGVSLLGSRARAAATAVLTVLVLSSATISLGQGRSMSFVTRDDLLSLTASGALAAEPNLNLKLGHNVSESMIAALLVPSPSVVVTDRTYAQGDAPRGSRFLVRTDQLESAPYSEIVRLNDSYAVASLDLTLQAASVDFTTADPQAGRFLYGSWYAAEPGGTWSGQRDNYLVFDLPAGLRGHDVGLVITGHAFANDEASQEIEVLVNGSPMQDLVYPDDVGKLIELVVPAAASEATAGRITIDFRTFRALSPSAYGSADGRRLAFYITRLDIAPL